MEPERGPGSARMQPMPFRRLIARIGEEYRAAGSVFGIPEELFFRKRSRRRAELFGEECDLPLGPAAGPHTQLAQNIVAAWLAGGRSFELKTVQKLDALAIDKPCIDAADTGYNTEWSTELSLEEACGEYVKAWVILHLLEAALGRTGEDRSFLFDLSVGYDLEGIRSPRMDRFIDGLIDASGEPVFRSCLEELAALLEHGEAFPFGSPPRRPQEWLARISPRICRSVSLSTMHGCPPAEIEAICAHLLERKGLATVLKLNPTLLGFERVSETLRGLGWDGVALEEEPFRRDLSWADALRLLAGLRSLARERGRFFGVKLTNTLEVANTRGVLPGPRMYMSGPALYPLAIQVAARLAEAFDGRLPISFSGGATAANVGPILAVGIRPVTAVTELLKPGGLLRLREMAERAEAAPGWERETVDVEGVRRLADEARAGAAGAGPVRRRPGGRAAPFGRPLPLFDCAAAPCVAACPIGQDVPGYVRLVERGALGEALEVILRRNPLPAVTGRICEQPCVRACTRREYDEPVRIRELKRAAAEGGALADAPPPGPGRPPGAAEPASGGRAAVVGGGPAGLAAAFFLAREGWAVTVFETAGVPASLRGSVARLPAEALRQDRRRIEGMGVGFRRADGRAAPAPARLREQGFDPILLDLSAAGGERFAGATDLGPGVRRIGDARAGCPTVVRCIADARRAVEEIGRERGACDGAADGASPGSAQPDPKRIALRRGVVRASPLAAVGGAASPEGAALEAARCLECATVCNRCVDVCPNRANLAIPVPAGAGWTNPFQIVHVAAWCNECGNCATFCPYAGGRPYRDKLTLFPDAETFQASRADGLVACDGELRLRVGGGVHRLGLSAAGDGRPGAADGACRSADGTRPGAADGACRSADGTRPGAADPRLEAILRLLDLLWRDHHSLLSPEGRA